MTMPKPYHYRTKCVGLRERDYLALAKKKQAVEATIGKRLNWSDFLLLMAGLKSVADEQRIAHLAQGERSDEESETPSLPGTSQVEEIVARQVDRVIREMRNHR
jgi:hypothetical protein